MRLLYFEKMKAATIIDDFDEKPAKKGGCSYLFQFASLIFVVFLTLSCSARLCSSVIVGRVTDPREGGKMTL